MNGMQKRKCSKSQPGCIGRMVKLFDIDGGMTGSKLLTDKPHRNGYTIQNCPVEFDMSSEEKDMISSQVSEASGKTHMKMHVELELCKEYLSSYTPPNLVARLMGLDTLPKRQADTALSKRKQDCVSTMLGSDEALPSLPHESKLRNAMPCKDEQYLNKFVCDTYHGQRANGIDEDDHNVAFARHTYIGTRHLAAVESIASPEKSEGEVEILKSNKDLFAEFLQQPNPSLTHHLNEMSTFPPCGMTRITVLKPSKTADDNSFPGMKTEKWVSKPTHAHQANAGNKPNFSGLPVSSNWKAGDEPQPTRIVVLKPSLEKSNLTGNEYVSPMTSPSTPHGENSFLEEMEPAEQRFRGAAKEITNFIRKSLESLQIDDPFLSPVLSSGYNGDESSPDESGNDYATGSESETASPTSRFSWSHVNQLASSSSSVSHEPRVLESFVSREAKKRLSRRWSATGLNSNSQLQRHARSLSSSTLGEMLALSEIRKSIRTPGDNVEEPVRSSACLNQNLKEDSIAEHSPRNLTRSKSVPLSAGGSYEWVNVGTMHPDVAKSPDRKQCHKTKSLKSLVTSLFFSRTKKSNKDNFTVGLYKDESSAASFQIRGSQSGQIAGGTSSHEVGLSLTKPVTTGNIMESQDQPSPVSVLEPLFANDESRSADASGVLYAEHPAPKTSVSKTNSPMLGKSPRIESVARTLWDSSCADTASACPFNLSLVCNGPREEQDWCILVPALLSTLGLSNDVLSDACMDRWHAPQLPLDPLLRDKYAYVTNHAMHEAKRRRWRSNRKLIFDSVNQALLNISQLHLETNSSRHCDTALPILVDQVWTTMSQWIADNARCLSSNDGEDTNHHMVVERVARREVAGKRWVDVTSIEINTVGRDIEQKLLDDLLEEAVLQLTARTKTGSMDIHASLYLEARNAIARLVSAG